MIKSIQEKNSPRVGVGLIVVKEGKVLLGKRKNAHAAGNWGPPGGHLKHGESIEECALRELREETDLKGISLRLGPWTNDIIDEKTHYISLYIFVDFFEGEPKLKEPHKCEEWKWFDWNDLPSPLFPSMRSLILTMGMERLKQTSYLSCSSLQETIYPGKNAHPLFLKLISRPN